MTVKSYPTGYKIPKYNALLISCIDLRLNDNIVHFMEHENLTNRYDQYIMAGSSIGALFDHVDKKDDLIKHTKYFGWWQALENHIELAIELHDIRDIYLIEHRNCGAYKYFLKEGKGNYEYHGKEKEFKDHLRYAKLLTERIEGLPLIQNREKLLDQKHVEKDKKLGFKCDSLVAAKINIHSFLMDMDGDVEFLHSTAPDPGGKNGKITALPL